jgi:hypothetical protein
VSDYPDDEIALVCGSRSLVERGPAAEAWGRHLITCIADHAEVFLSGDADGPDAWARDEVVRVSSERLRGRFYRLNGLVTDAWGTPLGRWAAADRVPPPGHPQRRRWPLVRDLVMVRALALRARRDGRRVACYGLVDPASTTHGTAYTLRCARDAGVATHAERWDARAWAEQRRDLNRLARFEGDPAR